MKAHLLVFDGTQVDAGRFRDAVDRMPSVENWTLFFGNAMCLASEKDAFELSKQIRQALPNVRFFLTTIEAQKDGWLPKDLWTAMDNPVSWQQHTDA